MELNTAIFLLLLPLMLALGFALGFFFARQKNNTQVQKALAQASSFREQLLVLQGQAAQLSTTNSELHQRQEQQNTFLQALAPVQQQLDALNQQMQQLGRHTAGASEKIFTQLANDAKLQAELRATANELNAALRSSAARGNWGEIQLQRIIEAAGMLAHVDFDLQRTGAAFTANARDGKNDFASLRRPDAIIHLPNGGQLAIDAKVPLASYLKAQAVTGTSSEAHAQRKAYFAAHAKAMAQHIKELVKRNYPADFPHSPQITILFVPSEALLSQALQSDAALLENALRSGIVLTSPTSLLALLRAIAAIWASAAATNEAAKIVELGRTLVDRLNVTVKHFSSLGKSLTSAVKHYNAAIGSLETRVLATARGFHAIETQGMEIEHGVVEISSEAGQIREFTSPEFSGTTP